MSISESDTTMRHGITAGIVSLFFYLIFTCMLPVYGDDGEYQLVGRQPDGSVVLPTNQIIRPAGEQVEFLGRPNAAALSPDGKTVAFLNGTYKAIILVDLDSATVKQEFDAAGSSASFNGIIYSKDGSKLYASQANGSIIFANVADDGTISLDGDPMDLPQTDGNPYPGGMALSRNSKTLYVVLNRNNTLAEIDIATRTVVAEIPVGNVPFEVIIKGRKAYVSNRGGRPAEDGDFTNDSSGTDIVSDDYSASPITGTVSVVDLLSRQEINTIEVGLHPSAMLLDGERLFVANTNSDSVSIIDLETEEVVKTIGVQPFVGAPFGSSPNALALMHKKTLVVSLGRNNALAIYHLEDDYSSPVEFKGLVPTAWYPTGVIADRQSKRLIVANGKGVGSLGPEATVGPDPATNATGLWVHSNVGSTSIIAYPSERELRSYTKQVYHNNNWTEFTYPQSADEDEEDRVSMHGKGDDKDRHHKHRKQAKAVPIPKKLGDPSVFKHVFYIVKENRTYDQILADLPQGNGDIDLLQFGREYTPNQHAMAEGFVLFDNLYDAGSLSADGHQWITQAYAVDYLEKSFGGWTRSYPYKGGDAMAYAPSGFLWENALRNGKTVRVYGEYAVDLEVVSGEFGTWTDFYQDYLILRGEAEGELHVDLETRSDIPSLDMLLNRDYPNYTMVIPDVYRVEFFLKEFAEYVENGNLPDLIMMHLPTDHTAGTNAGYPTPGAMIADNDLALARVVEAVAHSPYWKDSVFFIIEDDAQNGVDHVDGHRTIGFVVSPYTKRGIVDSRYYTQIDFVRTMEQILGLPPMNQMDLAVPPDSMAHIFTMKPDFTPYEALPNLIPLDQMNPSATLLSSAERVWQEASSKLDFSGPDRADEEVLNRIIWHSAKGYATPYPKDDGKLLTPDEL